MYSWFIEELNRNIISFDDESDRLTYLQVVGEKHPDYIAYRSNNKVHVKIYCLNEPFHIEHLEKNIQIYDNIGDLDITPPLIECRQLLKFKVGYFIEGVKYYEDDRLGAVYIIVTERYGQSLATKYMGLDADDPEQGPGPDTDNLNEEDFNLFFPPEEIPKHIRDQIRPLLQKLKEAGWSHDDIHAGNFVVDNDVVKIIDFDCVSRI